MKKDIYFFNSGRLSRKNNTLFLETAENPKYIPVNDVDTIHVFAEMDINKSLLEFLTESHITIHFYNYYDYYVGSYYPREFLNSGYVILKQAENYLDIEKRIYLARKFIEGAINNILQVLKYYNRRNADLEKEINQIMRWENDLQNQDTIEKIMAIEGNVRQLYYQCFNKILNNNDFVFEVRSRRPPKDRINSLISFGNSMIYTLTLSQIYQTQLDPRIGYLHSTNDRRFSLNLDISEIFKPIIVDRAIFSLINKKIITKKDFSKDLGRIVLKDEAKKLFVKEINDKLEATIQHPTLNMKVSYKRLIRLEAYKVQKHITEEENYEPFIAKW